MTNKSEIHAELHEELAIANATITRQRLELDALRAKLAALTESYSEVEAEIVQIRTKYERALELLYGNYPISIK